MTGSDRPEITGGSIWKHNQIEDTYTVDFDRWCRARAWRIVWPRGGGPPGEIPNDGNEWALLALARRRQGATVTALFTDGTHDEAPPVVRSKTQLAQRLCLIAAVARNGAIGKDNGLLLHLPGDLPRFMKLTSGCPVVMGRKTWDSIGGPLPQRQNIVLTRNAAWTASGADSAASLVEALRTVDTAPRVYVIGGAEIFKQALPMANELALTEIDADLEGDTLFPEWDRSEFEMTFREDHVTQDGVRYSFTNYSKVGR